MAANLAARFSGDEISIDSVVADAPVIGGVTATDATEGLEKFEESDIVAVGTLQDGESVGRDGGVDGELLVVGGGGGGQECDDGEQER